MVHISHEHPFCVAQFFFSSIYPMVNYGTHISVDPPRFDTNLAKKGHMLNIYIYIYIIFIYVCVHIHCCKPLSRNKVCEYIYIYNIYIYTDYIYIYCLYPHCLTFPGTVGCQHLVQSVRERIVSGCTVEPYFTTLQWFG